MEVQMDIENFHPLGSKQVGIRGSSQFQPNPDKRLQELRLLALEYVKQIVAKSIELSQQTHNKTQERAATQQNGNHPGTDNHHHQRWQKGQHLPENDPATMQLIRDASVQINKKFRLDQPGELDVRDDNRRVKSASAPNSNKKTATFARVDQFTSSDPNDTITTTTSKTRDYMEQDHATQYEQDNTTLSSGNSNNFNKREAGDDGNSSGAGVGGAAGPRRRLKGLHQRLNWHLLVSCFSTCLPETLVDTTTGKRTNNETGPTSV